MITWSKKFGGSLIVSIVFAILFISLQSLKIDNHNVIFMYSSAYFIFLVYIFRSMPWSYIGILFSITSFFLSISGLYILWSVLFFCLTYISDIGFINDIVIYILYLTGYNINENHVFINPDKNNPSTDNINNPYDGDHLIPSQKGMVLLLKMIVAIHQKNQILLIKLY